MQNLNEKAIEKIKSYCYSNERCELEVSIKLKKWGVKENDIQNIITSLKEDNLINEERYSRAFCRGKFRIKEWGKRKIFNELRKKNISERNIKQGILEIDDEEYYHVLSRLFKKKESSLKDTNKFIKVSKVIKHLEQKGFETNLIWEMLRNEK